MGNDIDIAPILPVVVTNTSTDVEGSISETVNEYSGVLSTAFTTFSMTVNMDVRKIVRA